MKQQICVVISDLDNTLYDWVEMWYQAFSSMLDHLEEETHLDRTMLKEQIQLVFQKHGTSEYEFVIEELPILRKHFSNRELAKKYQSVIQTYHSTRQTSMHLYPTVATTLHALKTKGCRIVGYTESMAFYTIRRVKTLGLDGLLDFLYSPADHDLPEDITPEQREHFCSSSSTLQYTRHRYTPKGELKPNPAVLRDIVEEVDAPIENTIYVGDSLMKDIAMAKDSGITDVFAQYGVAQHREAYELLRQVTHWSEKDVERERRIHERAEVKPNFTLVNNFSEILNMFDFFPCGYP